jgi:hypothetical protein
MDNTTAPLPKNDKSSSILFKMLEDKRYIKSHIKGGGKLSDLKDKFNFATPLSIRSQASL